MINNNSYNTNNNILLYYYCDACVCVMWTSGYMFRTHYIMLRSSRFFNYWFFIRINVLVNRRRRYVFRRPNITPSRHNKMRCCTRISLLLYYYYYYLGPAGLTTPVGRSVEFHWKTATITPTTVLWPLTMRHYPY